MGTIATKLPDEKHEECIRLAERRGLNITNLVRSLLYAELEREREKERSKA